MTEETLIGPGDELLNPGDNISLDRDGFELTANRAYYASAARTSDGVVIITLTAAPEIDPRWEAVGA